MMIQNLMLKMKQSKIILIFAIILFFTYSLDPTRQIQLYPNTENSDSIYIFSFKLSKNIPAGSYILVNLDWYTQALTPYKCIMVNTTVTLSCTNFATPTFPLTISTAKLLQHNQYLNTTTVVAILLGNDLNKTTQYNIQLHLYNKIPNIRRISPSSEIYVVSKDSLVYEQNINYGPAIHRPPIDTVLIFSIINSLSSNAPGSLSTLKAQFKITVPIETDMSAFTLVLHHPFSFSLGSLPKSYPSQLSATNTSVLLSKPTISQYRIISPNIFYVVFNQKFVAGRRFILQIPQINNPYLLAQSNISIYSMNYNSLTPLQGFQHGYSIQTVSYPLTVALNMPFDQSQTGPRQFYKTIYQYVKVDITVLNKAVPLGYSIRIVIVGGTITEGSADCNIQSLTYDPVYVYGSNYLIIKNIGPILVGTKIEATFQIFKSTTPTSFSFNTYIDTDSVINTFTAANYMYQGSVTGSSVDKNSFLNNFYDDVFSTSYRISHNVLSNTKIIFQIYPTGTQATSTGAFLQIYLPPFFIVDGDFNANTDCRFGDVINSANCLVTKTPSHVKLQIKSTNAGLNPLPFNSVTSVYLYNVMPPRSTSNRYIYPIYFTLVKNSAPLADQYYDMHLITVMPKFNGLANLRMQQHSNVYDNNYTYPGFIRVQSTTPTQLNFTLQQNEIRVITVVSRYGFEGMGNINNQDPYPCSSNIQIKCTFLTGHKDFNSLELMLQWDRIVITFPNSDQNSKVFHVIIPDSVLDRQTNYYYHFVGTYNKLTKDYNYLYMKDAFYRNNWVTGVVSLMNTGLSVNFGGKAGSYKKNVTINISNTNKNTGDFSFLCISTSWPFYEKGISSINAGSLAPTNLTLGANQAQPLSVYMGSGMYLTAIPMKYTSTTAPTTFTIMLDNVHLPYEYDLPTYYIYFIDSGNSPQGNVMTGANQFIMTNAGIFYESPLKNLTINCLHNALGVKNTYCTIMFGTQNPLKADGAIRLVFSGMTIATDICELYQSNGTQLSNTCSSSADNKNLTIYLSGFQHYAAGQFTLKIYGVGITQTQISQSFVLYLYDSTTKYVIQKGNRILTTTIAKQKIIQVYEILYLYNSPLSFNKMSIKFYLPRQIFKDQQFGFIMGKDLSDVNTEIKRLNIKLIKSDGTQLSFLYRLISTQYKVMFSFDDPTQLTQSNYTLQIYGIRTPTSHQNGQFNIIFQRKFDKGFTLINQISASFPILRDYIISDMSINSYFNTEGYDQQIDITIKNRALPVNNKMIWIVNLPSYYSPLIFNYKPYCLIEGSPITCQADPNTPYQLIITNSPRIIASGIYYTISILGIACPRVIYMNNIFPNRYMFIGILQNSLSQYYQQTNSIYPQQNVYTSISGIIGVQNMLVASTNLTSFYNAYMTIVLKCNVAIAALQYLYVVFPPQFNNFNNKPLNVILKVNGSVLATYNAPILDRRMQMQIPSAIALNTQINLEMTNVPTPTLQVSSQMSSIISWVTTSTKKQITAASAVSGNSAPKLTFIKDTRYISFNTDQIISITAGTFSSLIDIKSSDSKAFLTNVKISLSSTGFTFQPSDVLLKLGDNSTKFRIGADKDLYPISYFYTATKQQQVQTFYKITTNNNIMITNTPVSITIPSTINLPKGGCSSPVIIKLTNPPVIDMSISFNYNNSLYNQNVFFVNPHTTKSTMTFTSVNDNNTISFCSSANITGSSIPVKLVLTGTNYFSYQFAPSNTITFNLIAAPVIAAPSITVAMINQQKTFIDFNLTLNVDGIVYYNLFIGDSTNNVRSSESIQIYLKNQLSVVQSKLDFMSNIYLSDRDQRVGQATYTAGQYTIRFNDMVPQTSYVFCAYLQNNLRILNGPFCKVIQTQAWGNLQVMKLTFTKTVSAFQLNKVMCFFTKFVDTKTNYLMNIQGNSCNDNAVKNINFLYTPTTFSNDKKSTLLYLAPNPYLTSDPSVVAFDNMFDSNLYINPVTLSAALSGYGIDFISSGISLKTMDIRRTSARAISENLVVSFTKPVFTVNKIIVDNIQLYSGTNYGTVYFVLVKYKEFVFNSTTGQTSVRIRLNTPPSPYQMLNCLTWQNITADGCARAVYSGSPLTVQLPNIQSNSMYLLYYMAANQFPFRPVVGYVVKYQSIVTMNYGINLIVLCKGMIILLLLMIFNQ